MNIETDNQVRLRRAKEAVSLAQDRETSARMALNTAMKATIQARERYNELFLQEEREAAKRILTERTY